MEIISSYLDNTVTNFKLPEQLNEYIYHKNKEYLKEVQQDRFNNLPGRKLELITAIKNRSLMYEDVPKYIKKQYGLPYRDEGIDVIKLDSNNKIITCFQCKDHNGYVSHHDLGTFWSFKITNDKLKSIPFICIGSNETRFPFNTNVEIYDITEFNINLSNIPTDKPKEQPFKPHVLRDYQLKSIEHIDKAMKDEVKDIRVKLPCGCGKSSIIYHYCNLYRNDDKKILILVSKINIAEQIYKKLKDLYQLDVNCYWSEAKTHHSNNNIHLCVYNSINNVPKYNWNMIFVDEAHHILGSELYNSMKQSNDSNNGSYINTILNLNSVITIYLSATIDLKTIYDYEYSMDQAIENKYLVDYEIDLMYIDRKNRETDLIRIINENKEYKHIIIFCNTKTKATHLTKILIEFGIKSDIVTSDTKKTKRDEIFNSFNAGNLKVIVSVQCLNEGTDLPIADTAIFYDNRKAEVNIIQSIGRVLRLCEFKSKAKIVLLDSNSKECEKACNYYLNAINKTDKWFKHKIDDHFNCYSLRNNDEQNDFKKSIQLNIKEDKYFQKIIKTRITFNDRFESCKRFYDQFKRLPKPKEPLFEDWNIGTYIHQIMKRRPETDEEKKQIETLFKCKLTYNKHLTYDEKFDLCREYYSEFKRLPLNSEPKYKDKLNICKFFDYICKNNYEDHIKEIENIFECIHTVGNKFVHKNEIFEYWLKFDINKFDPNTAYYDVQDFRFYSIVLKLCISKNKYKIIEEFNEKINNKFTIDYLLNSCEYLYNMSSKSYEYLIDKYDETKIIPNPNSFTIQLGLNDPLVDCLNIIRDHDYDWMFLDKLEDKYGAYIGEKYIIPKVNIHKDLECLQKADLNEIEYLYGTNIVNVIEDLKKSDSFCDLLETMFKDEIKNLTKEYFDNLLNISD